MLTVGINSEVALSLDFRRSPPDLRTLANHVHRPATSPILMSALLRIARGLVRNPSTPRQFPTTGFEVITSSHLVEEEQWEWYKPEEFYPVCIGGIFRSQYQVVGKVGYGVYATAWLCRDLQCTTLHNYISKSCVTHLCC